MAGPALPEHPAPLSGNRRRSQDLPCLLYAVILAQATNLGLSGMARASQFNYQQLETGLGAAMQRGRDPRRAAPRPNGARSSTPTKATSANAPPDQQMGSVERRSNDSPVIHM